MAADAPALSLSWTFGSSTSVAHNVLNLSDGFSERVCYVAAHTAIIYDKKTRRQLFLQGHANAITCLVATEDRSAIITADVGQESLLVLWDSSTGSPLQIIKHPHPHGVVAMDVSPDSAWLATMGAMNPNTGEQEIALWALDALRDGSTSRPAVLTAIPPGDPQFALRFNTNNPRELVSNGRRRVYFWASHPGSTRFKYYSPPLRSKDFKQPVGDYVMSVFVPGSMQALTCTADGDLVVWDEQGITAQLGTRATDRRAVKLMRIHQTAVTYLGTIGDYVVSGGQDGFIRFYDPLLRIVAWFEDLSAGPIRGLSFSLGMPSRGNQVDMADSLNRFLVPDFVVFTATGRLVSVQSSSFEEYDAEKRKGSLVLEPMLTDVVCVACHPTKAEFAVLGRCGTLQRWDAARHLLLTSRAFTKSPGAHAAYSRDGSFLAVAFDAGYVHVLNTDDLQDVHATRNTPHNVLRVATSATGRHLALADAANQVLLYAHLPYKHIMRWEFVGKARPHHGLVVGLCFGESPSGQTRLFSLGAEGRLVEYDLDRSSPAAGLVLGPHMDFPLGNAAPTALCFAPPLPYFKQHSDRTLLLVSEAGYKVRVLDPDAAAFAATLAGPTFGGPLQQLHAFRSCTSDASFLAYACGERVAGLVVWPTDGDPSQSMGLVAHPGAITTLAVSYNGRKLVTAGADGTLCIWDVNTSVLDPVAPGADGAVVAESSAAAAARWAAVLDDQQLLQDLRDYFDYAQIRTQGESCMEPRARAGLVPAALLPDLLCAVGFYPSQAQVADLNHHLQYIAHSRGQDAMTHLDFATLLQLYVNHRPLQDAGGDDLAAAIKALGANPAGQGRIQRDTLLAALQQHGETMSVEELVGAVLSLTGAERLADALPHVIDVDSFATGILGLDVAPSQPQADAAGTAVAVS